MKLNLIKTEVLISEIKDRIGDQLADPEPQYDEVFSHLTAEELDWLLGELMERTQTAQARRKSSAER
jgi:hypothetical protein